MTITIETTNARMTVESPYDFDFVRKARQLGGRWEKPVWIFDPANAELVSAALKSVYHHDGSPQPTTTLILSLDELPGWPGDRLVAGSVEIARKHDRDSTPRLGPGCVVVAGELRKRGGSRNNPAITFEPGTQIRIPGVPLTVADFLRAENPQAWQILDPALAQAPAASNGLSEGEQELLCVLKAMPADRRSLILAMSNQ